MTASISVGRCAAAAWSLAAVAWLAGGAGPIAAAEPVASTSPAEAAIRASAAAFEKAFNARAAADVAALWTLHGTLVDDRGEKYRGREAIRKQYDDFFKDFFQAFPDAKIKVAIKSIEFPAPTMAVEEGVSSIVTSRAAPPIVGAYTATHVLDGGQWLIAAVRETAVPPASNVARLQQELGWLIGRWQAKHDERSLQTTAAWVGQKSFIRREYTVCQGEKVVSSGVQVIGWDPRAGRIRSWSFDATGGFGSGLWSTTADGWAIESVGTLPDGTPTSSREYVIRVPGEDRIFGWRSVGRLAGQSPLPDTGEIVLERVSTKQAKGAQP